MPSSDRALPSFTFLYDSYIVNSQGKRLNSRKTRAVLSLLLGTCDNSSMELLVSMVLLPDNRQGNARQTGSCEEHGSAAVVWTWRAVHDSSIDVCFC